MLRHASIQLCRCKHVQANQQQLLTDSASRFLPVLQQHTRDDEADSSDSSNTQQQQSPHTWTDEEEARAAISARAASQYEASMSSRGVQPSSSSVRGSRSNHSSHHSNLMADLLRSLIAPHRLRPSSSHMRPHHQTYNSSSWGSMHSRALHVSRGVMQEDTVYGSDVPIGVEAGMTDAQTRELIVSQFRSSQGVGQIKDLLVRFDWCCDEWALGCALDAMMKLPMDQRRSTCPEAQEVKHRLSALYMHLLPEMEPTRSVKMLQTLAQLSVCMHEPGKNQEGFTAVNNYMASKVSPVLMRADNDLDVISMLWALAKHSHHGELQVDEEMFRNMAQYLLPKVHHLEFRQLSKLAQAYAMVGVNEWSLVDQICSTAYLKLSGNFEPGATINMLDALSKLKVENESFVNLACKKMEGGANIRSLKAGNLTTVAKALAEMRYDHSEDVWRKLMDQAQAQMNAFTTSQIVSFLWALSRRGIADITVHKALAYRAEQLLPDFNASELASLMYLLGKQGLVPGPLMPKLSDRAKELIGSMSLRNVSNLIRGFQLLGYGDPPSEEAASDDRSVEDAKKLYKMAAGRAKAWLQDPAGRLVLSVQGNTEVFMDDEMRKVERIRDVDSANTYERVHYKSGNVVQTQLLNPNKRYFISQNLSDISLALADRGVAEAEVFACIAARAKETIRSFSLVSLVDVACGFAQAGFYDEDTFLILEGRFAATYAEMGPQYLADTLWAFATLRHPVQPALLKSCMDTAWSRWHRTSADQQLLARLIWALYTLDADTQCPDHMLFAEFQRLLDAQGATSSPPAEGGERQMRDIPAEQQQ